MSASRTLARHSGRLAVTAIALIAAGAVLVHAVGAADVGREALDLELTPPGREPATVGTVAATNLRLAGAALLAAWVVQHHPPLRPALDLTLGLAAALNLALVGLALGSYGTELATAIALHGPLEVVAFAVAGGAYLSGRDDRLTAPSLAAAAGIVAALLVAAALVETTVGRTQ